MNVPAFAHYFDKSAALPGSPISSPTGYRSIEADTYHAFPALNASLLKQPSAAHMLHALTEKDEPGHDATCIGTLTHWAVLEPHKIANLMEYVVECPTKGLDTKAADATRAENPGKLVVTAEHLIKAVALRRAIAMHDGALELLSREGVNEASGLLYKDGLWRKWRADRVLLDGTRIIDVKTTRVDLCGQRGLANWVSECWKLGYWLQAAWYLHHHEIATGIRPNAWTFIAVCTSEPFHCRIFTVQNTRPGDFLHHDGSALQRARQMLGFESGQDVDRVTMFTAAASQTAAMQASGQTLSPEILRSVWAASEDQPEAIIGLPTERA